MSVTKIHHINFIVEDLSAGIDRYRKLLGIDNFVIDDLPGRGVKTARSKVGDSWLVLVQPVDMTGIPGKHLQQHGEGFFLISYSVDDLQQAAANVVAQGSAMTSEIPRQGLENWQVWDIDQNDTLGTQIQFCEEK
ncbi:VOC family protein [Oceanicoccus sp. KOV_DT_Chl]|uniref:VOC family protein n=1 Tax=Oceanicoccus sp. KOV_DT_Chl TaxID=1904639 RepID=UPI00190E7582|nr:VOC family protein [Oceanicoccus sp. KOV_DT_Chl]